MLVVVIEVVVVVVVVPLLHYEIWRPANGVTRIMRG